MKRHISTRARSRPPESSGSSEYGKAKGQPPSTQLWQGYTDHATSIDFLNSWLQIMVLLYPHFAPANDRGTCTHQGNEKLQYGVTELTAMWPALFPLTGCSKIACKS